MRLCDLHYHSACCVFQNDLEKNRSGIRKASQNAVILVSVRDDSVIYKCDLGGDC